jgi:hypothetical protein
MVNVALGHSLFRIESSLAAGEHTADEALASTIRRALDQLHRRIQAARDAHGAGYRGNLQRRAPPVDSHEGQVYLNGVGWVTPQPSATSPV